MCVWFTASLGFLYFNILGVWVNTYIRRIFQTCLLFIILAQLIKSIIFLIDKRKVSKWIANSLSQIIPQHNYKF